MSAGVVLHLVLVNLFNVICATGFTIDQLANYGRDQRITRPIAMQFRDVRSVPRFSGKLTDDLLAAANDPGELVRIAHSLTDAVAGRNFPRPKGASPLRASLVPAFNQCTSGNRTHGASLSFPSCASPVMFNFKPDKSLRRLSISRYVSLSKVSTSTNTPSRRWQ